MTYQLEKSGIPSKLIACLKMVLTTPYIDMPPKCNVPRYCRTCVTKSHDAGHKTAKSNTIKIKTMINACSHAVCEKHVVPILKEYKGKYCP